MFEFSLGEIDLMVNAIILVSAVIMLGLCNPDFNGPGCASSLRLP